MPITTPTKSSRLNLTLQENVIKMIKLLAFHDNVSPTTKAAEILKNGLELEEDTIMAKIAEQRLEETENGDASLISHEDFWNKAIDE